MVGRGFGGETEMSEMMAPVLGTPMPMHRKKIRGAYFRRSLQVPWLPGGGGSGYYYYHWQALPFYGGLSLCLQAKQPTPSFASPQS